MIGELKRIFQTHARAGKVDFEYDTQTYIIKAHGAYFEQDRFYARLRARMDTL